MSSKLDNYTVLNMIGKGGMATVYRAVQKSLDRTVALKELDLSQSHSVPAAAERFRLEAKAAASLEHTGIINIYDFWEEEKKAYIAMELIDGFELKEGLAACVSMDPALAVHIALEVAEALKYAHARGIIHRDVKPANIMLTTLGDVKLADFGIVSVTGTAELTMADQILGTPAYMSPEQVTGRESGPHSDIFSLGIVIYEMVTGKRPFAGTNPVALIQSIVKDEPEPPGSLAEKLPAGLSGVIMKCLEKDPDMRYAQMGQLLGDLERCRTVDTRAGEGLVGELVRAHRSESGNENGGSAQATKLAAARTGPAQNTAAIQEGTQETSGLEFQVDDTVPGDLAPLQGLSGRERQEQRTDHHSDRSTPREVHLEFAKSEQDAVSEEDEKKSRGKKRRSRLPVLLIVAAALAALAIIAPRARNGSRKAADRMPPPAVKKAPAKKSETPLMMPVPSRNTEPVGLAYLKIAVRPAGSVFIDGKALGDARSGESFRVTTGLHTIVIRNRRYGSRSFMVDFSDGERKKIAVDFLKQTR